MNKSLLLFLIIISFSNGFNQKYNESKMPFVTENLFDKYPLFLNAEHLITIGGAWGGGVSAQYTKRKVIHAKLSAGYAWGFATSKSERENPLKKSHWQPFAELAAGYPVLDFTWGLRGKYITSQYTSGKYKYQNGFRVKIPVTTMIIPVANFRLNPYTFQFSRGTGIQTDLPTTMKYTAVLPTLGFGLKVLTIGCANFRGKEGDKSSTYTAQRMGSIYIGITKSILKKEITPGKPYRPILADEKLGLDIMFEISPYHNSIGTINFGVRSIGYNNNAQFVIGNTFILN